MVRSRLDRVEHCFRELSNELHPRIVADLGLRDAMAFLAESFFRRTGITVKIELQLRLSYGASVETLVYRFVHEALSNVSRHSRAANATVSLDGDREAIVCCVRDDGVGRHPRQWSGRGTSDFSLELMHDHLEAVGGTLEIISAPGGTELRATVPVSVG